MQILGDQQPGLIADAGQQVLLNGRADDRVKGATLDRRRVIAVLGADANDRCEQRHCGGGIQRAGEQFGFK